MCSALAVGGGGVLRRTEGGGKKITQGKRERGGEWLGILSMIPGLFQVGGRQTDVGGVLNRDCKSCHRHFYFSQTQNAHRVRDGTYWDIASRFGWWIPVYEVMTMLFSQYVLFPTPDACRVSPPMLMSLPSVPLPDGELPSGKTGLLTSPEPDARRDKLKRRHGTREILHFLVWPWLLLREFLGRVWRRTIICWFCWFCRAFRCRSRFLFLALRSLRA
jgi:hypothetical protein